MAMLLTACGGAPTPVVTLAPPTSAPILATSTATVAPVAAASATQAASPTSQPQRSATPLPSSSPAPPLATETSTPRPVPRVIPTPTFLPTASPRPLAVATVAATARATAVSTPRPIASATRSGTGAIKARIWDPRLDQRGAVLIPAQVQPGQGYWRLVQGQWFDEGEPPFGGQHHVFLDALDQTGKRQVGVRMQMASPDLKDILGYVTTEAKTGESYAANFPMYIVAPAYRVEPADGAPADAVTGLGLGSIKVPDLPTLTSYGFTWQWTIAGQGQAIPSSTPIGAGAGPASALSVPTVAQRLASGQRIWYAFRYAGDNSPIEVKMQVTPPGAASFAIWTPGDVQRWVQGNPESPVGRGAPKADTPGELFWTGAFSGSDIYYVAVDQTGPYTGSFTLQVSGSGVAPAGSGR